MIACNSRSARVVARNYLVSVQDDNLHWMRRVFYSRERIAVPFGKGITQRDEIIAKRSIVGGALFETIIALGWTRSDYWWTGQFHFARIIAQSMCLAVPKFRVIRIETDRTIRLV